MEALQVVADYPYFVEVLGERGDVRWVTIMLRPSEWPEGVPADLRPILRQIG